MNLRRDVFASTKDRTVWLPVIEKQIKVVREIQADIRGAKDEADRLTQPDVIASLDSGMLSLQQAEKELLEELQNKS